MGILGYMTEKQAQREGFTHHGLYYGIPIWITDDGECPMVCTKWAPLEFVMSVFSFIEGFIRAARQEEAMFMFKIGKPINKGE